MPQKMTADEALALAESWATGMTFDAKSDGPFDCLLALAEEVRRLRMELAHEEQRVADMMADVNRVGHEIERLRADAERWRALRELDGGEIYALLGDCDGIHPEQADAAIDRARGEENEND